MAHQAAVNGRRQAERPARALRMGIGEFTAHALSLAELQGRLLALDLKETQTKTLRPIILAAVAMVILLACLPVALLGGAWLLASGTALSEGAAMLILAGTFMVLAAVMAWFAWKKIRTSCSALTRSREEFSRNLSWIKDTLQTGGHAD
ncbi:MAG: phage holin family protein [Planctomycetes bacterium]|nr:phage holin family protein [Planctomycetota bacterium]